MENTSLNFWAMISSSLLSGIIGVVISTIYYRRHEAKKIKLETLTKVIANRYDLKGDEFSRALNEIFVIFQKSKPVMKVLSEFHEKTTTPSVSNEDALLRLIKAMCDDVSVSYDDVNDSFFLRPFNTRSSSSINTLKDN